MIHRAWGVSQGVEVVTQLLNKTLDVAAFLVLYAALAGQVLSLVSEFRF
jgi:hypothetical protein